MSTHHPGDRAGRAAAVAAVLLAASLHGQSLDRAVRKQVTDVATRFWQARPETRFTDWDPAARAALLKEAAAIELPDGSLDAVVDLVWEPVSEFGPGVPKADPKQKRVARPRWLPRVGKPPRRQRGGDKITLDTPWGEAWFWLDDAGPDQGLIVGLHGGGEGAGSADEPRSSWRTKDCMGVYPQGIHLVHDTWNTVHGERFVLTLIEIAKAQFGVDPDRVYTMGFSMGGTGSWFMAGRHADLLAGSAPCAGVLMASPQSQLATKEEVQAIQHGLLPNVRNLAMYYFIGLEDRNCMPGTYLYVADRLDELRAADPGGYAKIRFTTHEGLAHAFPRGEPAELLDWLPAQRREPFPAVVVWEVATNPFPQRAADDPHGRVAVPALYWLGCRDQTDGQRLRATRDGNEFTIDVERRASGTEGVTLWLNPKMIDPSAEVVVRSGDKELYRGRPQPTLAAVLESMDRSVDRVLVFDRRIDL